MMILKLNFNDKEELKGKYCSCDLILNSFLVELILIDQDRCENVECDHGNATKTNASNTK